MVKVCAIAAMDEGRLIGRAGELPWHIPEDLKHFSQLTAGHAVLMGWMTFQSLPPKCRPLPGRRNFVVSEFPLAEPPKGVEIWDSALRCIEACRKGEVKLATEKLWIIGGALTYRQTVPYWDEVYLTLVKGRREGDAFFPEFEKDFELVEEEPHTGFSFLTYRRRN